MSFIVLAIGVAHGLPPIIDGIFGKSKQGVLIGAAIGAAIGVISGNPVFIIIYLIGVGLGVWLGFSIVDQKPENNSDSTKK